MVGSPKIVFRCDGATLAEIGTGHVVRDLAIAQDLIVRGVCQKSNISFAIRRNGPFQVGFEMIRQQGWHVHDIADEQLEINSRSEGQALSELMADLIIIDRLDTIDFVVCDARKGGAKVLVMDDISNGTAHADMVINGIIDFQPSSENQYVGYDYLFLPQAFYTARAFYRRVVERLVIAPGGHDDRNLVIFILQALVDSPTVSGLKQVHVLCGNEHEEYRNKCRLLVDQLEQQKGYECIVEFRTSDFHDILQKADLAILSGGLTVFEALAYGIPVIGLPQYYHQLDTLRRLEKQEAVRLGSLDFQLKSSVLLKQIHLLVGDTQIRERLGRRGAQVIDGQGRERVIDLIVSLL